MVPSNFSTLVLVLTDLRHEFKAKRAALSDEARHAQATQTLQYLTDMFAVTPPQVIGVYWPLAEELDVKIAFADWLASGHRLALPCATPKQPLTFRELTANSPMHKGLYGIMEPTESNAELLPETLIVPALALDAAGNRLGYGGGYYDRTLAKWRENSWNGKTIGICFSCQISDSPLPAQPHDAPLDAVLSAQGFIKPLFVPNVMKP